MRVRLWLVVFFFLLFGVSISNGVVLQNGTEVNKGNYSVLKKNKKLFIVKAEYAPDRIIVKFKDGVSEAKIRSILEVFGSKMGLEKANIVRKSFKSNELKRIKVLNVKKGKVKEAVKLFRSTFGKYIEYVEPDYKVKMLATPNDPYYSQQWEWDIINAPSAWDTTTGSSDIVVGVIDTGVDYNHPDLADNIWSNEAECNGESDVDDDGNGYIDDCHGWNAYNDNGDPMDDCDHGTHVAGTIGAVTNNSEGVAGVNWHVKIAACKFLSGGGSGYTSDAVECFDYFNALKDNGVNIVATNNSWGGGGYSDSLYDAIKSAMDRGILVVVAAGNNMSDNDKYPEYPASYDLPNIISVAASTPDDTLSWYSNYGDFSVDLVAPGGAGSSGNHDDDIYSTCSEDPNSWICPSGDLYGYMAGTSMATPHVTGAAALLASYFTDNTWYQLRNKIFLGTDKIESFEDKVLTDGRLNLSKPFNLTSNDTMLRLGSPLSFTHYWNIFNPSETLDLFVRVLSINKDGSADWVKISLDSNETTLYDNGQNGDRFANDGFFEGNVTLPVKPIVKASISDSFGNGGDDPDYSGYIGIYELGVGYFDNYNYIEQNTDVSLQKGGIGGKSNEIKAIKKLPISYYDDAIQIVYLPFTVHFYGYPVNAIAISSNGVIVPYGDDLPLSTYDPAKGWQNNPIGEDSLYNSPIIAPLWADLNPSACAAEDCGVYMITMGNEVIFEWRNIPFLGQNDLSNGVTFRVVFDKDETIRFEYPDVTVGDSRFDNGKAASVGIQFNKDHAIQYSYNESKLSDHKVIYFEPQINQIFGDVSNDNPDRHYIDRLYLLGYTTGYNDNGVLNFHPDENLNRAQLVVFLDKMKLGVEGEFDYSKDPYFNDVPPDSWMFKWVQKAKELGLTSGCGNGNFCPNSSVTKAQMAIFMVRQALGNDDFSYNPNPYFNDVSPDHWAFKWVQKAYELGLAQACDDDGDFCPNQAVTRAYMAAQIIKILEEK